MTLAELRAKSLREQLDYILTDSRRLEILIPAIGFESLVRRIFRKASGVTILRFQQPMVRLLEAEVVEKKTGTFEEFLEPSILETLESDPDFFEAAVMPRALAGCYDSTVEMSWVAEFRGNLWQLDTKFGYKARGFIGVEREAVDRAEALGMRYLVITATDLHALKACVINQAARAACPPLTSARPPAILQVPVERFEVLGADVWASLTDLMARG